MNDIHGYINLHGGKQKKLVLTFIKTSFFPVPGGGDKRDRTADLLNAIQALSQLSYTPRYFQKWNFRGTDIKL